MCSGARDADCGIGGAAIQALVRNPPPFAYEVLALTRKAGSPAASKLSSHPHVKAVSGDLNDIHKVFENAGGHGAIWGVFSVQLPDMKAKTEADSKEVTQGCDLVDAAVKYGVKHFVYASVDRGGEKSWDEPTNVPHFITKHKIEHHLRTKATGTDMTWTILRPVAFMDNFGPNMFGRVMAGVLGQLQPTKLQLVSTNDIGVLAAQAFVSAESDDYKNAAISLAGDELDFTEANDIFYSRYHYGLTRSYSLTVNLIRWMVADFGIMAKFFKTSGFGADMKRCRQLHPGMLDFKTWLEEENKFGPPR